jgi:hypothetical protein
MFDFVIIEYQNVSKTDVIYARKKDVHVIIVACHYFNHDKSRFLLLSYVLWTMRSISSPETRKNVGKWSELVSNNITTTVSWGRRKIFPAGDINPLAYIDFGFIYKFLVYA